MTHEQLGGAILLLNALGIALVLYKIHRVIRLLVALITLERAAQGLPDETRPL